ncbi:MAG: YsnF/AvaK domain-containing protein, partial [Verrucomicrobiota bacterium]
MEAASVFRIDSRQAFLGGLPASHSPEKQKRFGTPIFRLHNQSFMRQRFCCCNSPNKTSYFMSNQNYGNTGRDTNPDPITGEPGSHPVATGMGAAGGGAAGAAIGMAGGPVGAVVGAVIGAVVGGLGGHAAGEAVDPTAEDAYWRESHSRQSYATSNDRFEDYQPAYRTGYEGYTKHGVAGDTFEKAEPKLRSEYEAAKPKVPWEKAKEATRAAWTRLQDGKNINVPISEEQVDVSKREVEGGSVRIRKEVHTETVNTPVQLRREEVVVTRVPSGQGNVPSDAFTEGEVRIPLTQ